MLSRDENELLTQVGPATPMGELFRRFWIPALLSEELPGPDCEPVRLRLLGEDLLAFKDSHSRIAILDAYCPHRSAPMFFGRNEECGLRCVYHGWKFNAAGECVDMPNEPAESDFRTKVRATAYPSAEYAGLVWIYMEPSDRQSPLPRYQWCTHPMPARARPPSGCRSPTT